MLRLARVHPRLAVLVEHLVAKEEHLAWLRRHLEPRAREEGIPAAHRHLTIGERGGDSPPLLIAASRALAVTMRRVLVIVVLVVNRIDRLLRGEAAESVDREGEERG